VLGPYFLTWRICGLSFQELFFEFDPDCYFFPFGLVLDFGIFMQVGNAAELLLLLPVAQEVVERPFDPL